MPFGIRPECVNCRKTECLMWRNTGEGYLCNDCAESMEDVKPKVSHNDTEQVASNSKSNSETLDSRISTRKSTRTARNYKTRLNPFALPKSYAPKGKGRRVIFKKIPTKAPSSITVPVTKGCVFYKGSYINVGDIVSLQDDDGGIYYAQIRGLLVDQYCDKSAVITWLLPTTSSPDPELGFDPSTYIIGPDEELPRKLECMEFVMHAPSDYYKSRKTPYPPVTPEKIENTFFWTRQGFERKPNKIE